jgi:hypothetical protein
MAKAQGGRPAKGPAKEVDDQIRVDPEFATLIRTVAARQRLKAGAFVRAMLEPMMRESFPTFAREILDAGENDDRPVLGGMTFAEVEKKLAELKAIKRQASRTKKE